MLPLEGLRVVDLTSVIFGPVASQVLADYGAEVIKVEPPEGDVLRAVGPTPERGMGAVFLGVNRGKRSVVLDLKTPQGQEALQRLVATADVLITTIRPRKLAAIGLEPQALRQAHPRLVFASLVGYGAGGPYSGQPAYDDIIQGQTGHADLMQRQVGTPQYFPAIVADKTSGLVAAHAILAALLGRERGGQGCHVEIPMFESMAAFNLLEHLYGHHYEPPLGRAGYPRVLNPWRRPFATADGHLCVLPYTDAHWQRFFKEIGRADLGEDARFGDAGSRATHAGALYQALGEALATRSSQEWLDLFEQLDIPCAPVARLDDLPHDPHLQATGFFHTHDDPAMGRVVLPGVPVRFDGRRPPARMAPRLGEHTERVLGALKE